MEGLIEAQHTSLHLSKHAHMAYVFIPYPPIPTVIWHSVSTYFLQGQSNAVTSTQIRVIQVILKDKVK